MAKRLLKAKKLSKVLAALMVVAMFFTLLPLSAFAAGNAGVNYKIKVVYNTGGMGPGREQGRVGSFPSGTGPYWPDGTPYNSSGEDALGLHTMFYEGMTDTAVTVAPSGVFYLYVDANGQKMRYDIVEWEIAQSSPRLHVDPGSLTNIGTLLEGANWIDPNGTTTITLKAVWSEGAPVDDDKKPVDKFEVKFVVDGFVISSQMVEAGGDAVAPALEFVQPKLPEGATFLGWDKDFTNVQGDLVVNARYDGLVEHTVRFIVSANGTFNVIDTQLVADGDSAVAPKPEDYMHLLEGYVFRGWTPAYDNITGDLDVFADVAQDKNDDKIGDDLQYELKYNANDGSALDEAYAGPFFYSNLHDKRTPTDDELVWATLLNSPTPTREGHIFLGWSLNKLAPITTQAEEDAANITTEVFMDANKTVYAVWAVDADDTGIEDYKEHLIRYGFTANGVYPPNLADLLPQDAIGVVGETYFVEDVPSAEGYVFHGWKAPAGLAVAEDGSFVMPDYEVQFEGTWEKEIYTVTFVDYDGETVLGTDEVPYGDAAEAPENPSREGYTFTGWDVAFDNITSDLTVTALYDINVYDVTFVDYNGDVLGTDEVEYGGAAEAPENPSREGYTFTGWDVAFDNITSDLTVTALYDINVYDVTFVDYNGDVLGTDEVEHGGAATAPANPSREGYTFTGWDVAFDNITSDLTVTAQYDINVYDVTFVDYNGDVLGTDEVAYGGAAEAPEDPSREGYTFTGWDVAFDNITSDLTVTAQYDINVYDVTFVDYNGDVLGTDEVEYGGAAEAPANPSREGYTFTGWDVAFDNITSDLTVTALYDINVYDVTFVDYNGDVLGTDEVAYGGAAEAPEDPSREGYTFTGWDVAFDNITSDLTVTAQYDINVYDVTFVDYDGETVLGTDEVEYGGAAEAPENPSREGYTFTGWDVAFDNITSDLTVTAQYDINVYDVTFVDYDGKTVLGTDEVEHGGAAEAPANPSREGYTFTGWDVAFDNITSDLTVTAQYDINVYDVTFVDYDGKTVLGTDEVEYGGAATAPENPSREGYTFTGWDVAFDNITSDLTVTAQYGINVYTVTFVDHDGRVIATDVVEHGDAATAPANPQRNGYMFTGWDKAFGYITEDLTVTAQYKVDRDNDGVNDDEEYTLTYNANGGDEDSVPVDNNLYSGIADAADEYATLITDPAPTYEGYVFLGWSLQQREIIETQLQEDAVRSALEVSILMDADKTVYAVWAIDDNDTGVPDYKEVYSITYAYVGEVPEGAESAPGPYTGMYKSAQFVADVPADIEGYVFKGWYLGDEIVSGSFIMPNNDVEFTGIWKEDKNDNKIPDDEEVPFTVTFVDGVTGETLGVQEVLVGLDAKAPAVPVHEGYVFIDWDTDFTNVQSNLTVTAEYKADRDIDGVIDEDEFTLTYDANGGVGAPVDDNLYSGIAGAADEYAILITDPAPTYEGHVFLGWSLQQRDVVVTQLQEDAARSVIKTTILMDENKTVYAVWAIDDNDTGVPDYKEHYKITYTYVGEVPEGAENAPGPYTGMYKSTVFVADVPAEVEGYVFKGWYLGDEVVSGSFIMPNNDVEFTGMWKEDKNDNKIPDDEEVPFTVTFIDGVTGETLGEPQSVLAGLDAVVPEVLEHEGYVFVEWDTDFTNVQSDLTVTAVYKEDKDGDGIDDELEFTLTYDANGGVGAPVDNNLYSGIEGREDEYATLSESKPTYEGYTFLGWSETVRTPATEQVHEDNMRGLIIQDGRIRMDSNKIVYALWAIDKNGNETPDYKEVYSITYAYVNDFAPEGAPAAPASSKAIYGTQQVVASVPAFEGYLFEGWFQNGSQVSGAFTMPGNDVVFLGIWKEDKNDNKIPDDEETPFVVTFIDGVTGETIGEPQLVLAGLDAVAPEVPVHEDYVFIDWDTIFTNVQSDLTVTAQYKADRDRDGIDDELEFTLTYDANGGVGGPVDTSLYSGIEGREDQIAYLLNEPAPTREEHVFIGWTLTPQAVVTTQEQEDSVPFITEVVMDSNKTVYAVWAEDKNENKIPDYQDEHFTVLFVDHDGTELKREVVLIGLGTTPPDAPTREKYVFVGWDTDEYLNVQRDLTVTAQYKEDKNDNGKPDDEEVFIVTFVDPDGLVLKTEEVRFGGDATEPEVPERDGLVHIGWDKEFTNVTEDLTVTALFDIKDDPPVFTITFVDGLTDDILAEVVVDVGEGAVAPEPPEHEGYTFKEWDTDAYLADVDRDLTVTALYEAEELPPEEFTVTFIDGLDGALVDTQQVPQGTAAQDPGAPTHDGYVFIGWDVDFTDVQSDLTVTARYEEEEPPPPEFDVVFVDGITEGVISSQKVPQGAAAVDPGAPTHDGYVFIGWDVDFSNIQSNLLVTAIYEETAQTTEFTVTFVDGLDGAVIATQQVPVGAAATAPAAPTHEGYIFIGWDVDFSNVQSDLTVTAVYEPVQPDHFTVTFVDGLDGAVIATQQVPAGAAAQDPGAPAHDGYTFVGWDTDFSNVQSDLTVTAVYTPSDASVPEEPPPPPPPPPPPEVLYHTVNFVDYNSALLKTEVVVHGGAATAPANPVRDGYTFVGWNADFSVVLSDLTVTALYEAIPAPPPPPPLPQEPEVEYFTVRFMPGTYGTFTPSEITGIESGSATPAAPAPTGADGWVFAGWSPEVAATVTGDATYVAQWEAATPPPPPSSSSSAPPPPPPAASSAPPQAPLPPSSPNGGTPIDDVTPPEDTTGTAGGETVELVNPTREEVFTQLQDENIPTMSIFGQDIPLAGGSMTGFVWALVNLVLAALGILFATMIVLRTVLRRKEEKQEGSQINTATREERDEKQKRLVFILTSVIMAIAGVVFFCLTEDITRVMVLVDKWTIVNAVIFAVEVVGMVFSFKREKTDEDKKVKKNQAKA